MASSALREKTSHRLPSFSSFCWIVAVNGLLVSGLLAGGCTRPAGQDPGAATAGSNRPEDSDSPDPLDAAAREQRPPEGGNIQPGQKTGPGQPGKLEQSGELAGPRPATQSVPPEPVAEVDDAEVVELLERRGAEMERDGEGFVVAAEVAGAELKGLLPRLDGLPRLRRLRLAGDEVTPEALDALRTLDGLRELDLFDTDVGDDGAAVLANMPGLEKLSLSGTRITDAALEPLAQLKSLRSLHLGWTEVTGRSIGHLEDLPRLEELDLSWTLVSDEQLDALARLKSVRTLVLENSEVSEAGAARLRERLTGCRIVTRDAVAAAAEAGSSLDYGMIGAGVGDRQRILAQQYQQARAEFLQRYSGATTATERSRIAQRPPSPRSTAQEMMKLAEENPDHPAAIDALLWIVRSEERFVQDLQRKATGQLLERYANHPHLGESCLQLAGESGEAVQNLLRQVFEQSTQDEVRGRAAYALAGSLLELGERARQVQAMDEARRNVAIELEGLLAVGRLLDVKPDELAVEAEQWLGRVVEKFGEVAGPEGPLREQAQKQLLELRTLAVGREAPEIAGEDIQGEPLRLSEHRGKVVVLTFWGNWCGPCRAMYPHERELVSRLAGEPFALLGVNSDSDRQALLGVLEQERITWRSWWDGGSTRGPIAQAWNVQRWPTIYVLDHQGVIRFKNVRGEALDEAVDQLLAELKAAVK